MNRTLTMVIAAGLLVAGRAYADDQDRTRDQTKDQTQDQIRAKDQLRTQTKDQTQDQLRTKDQLRTQTRDQTRDQTRTQDGLGDKVREMAQEQTKGDGANGIGAQVREMAQFRGCEGSDSAECKAHHAVHEALSEQAGPPTDRPALPNQAGPNAGGRGGNHAGDVEGAAMRHTKRMAGGEEMGEANANRRGAGRGMGGQGMGAGSGDQNQAAETTRSMHGGAGGMNPGSGMR